jgi:uncharacterized protein
MKNNNRYIASLKQLLILLVISISQLSLFAQTLPEQSDPPRLVNDFANIIQYDEEIESELVKYNNTTSSQISIVTISTTEGNDISDYAIKLFNKWQIGQAKKDNGVLILVAVDDRKTFIVTGRGVEDKLPDIICKRIVENDMIPSFKNQNYEQGIRNAIVKIQGYLDGTYKVEEEDIVSGDNASSISFTKIIFIIFLVIIILIFLSSINGGGGSTYTRRGYYGGGGFFGGGSWGGGGSSGGGGFGGFGGGSSGGGGAGGSW